MTWRWLTEYKLDTVGGLAKIMLWDKVKLVCSLFSGKHFDVIDNVSPCG